MTLETLGTKKTMETLIRNSVSIALQAENFTQEQMKEKILEGAGNLFLKYGIRSVSMDDIANNLAISKKTLYQYFEDKDDVVVQATIDIIEKEKQEFKKIVKSSKDSLEELSNVSMCLRRTVYEMNPSLLFDLNKYYGEAWKIYLDYKDKFIFKMVVDNLSRGIKEGFFRDDINPNILARLRVEEVQLCFDHKVFPREQYEFKEVQMQIFEHFLYGILTPEGKQLYESYQEKNIAK